MFIHCRADDAERSLPNGLERAVARVYAKRVVHDRVGRRLLDRSRRTAIFIVRRFRGGRSERSGRCVGVVVLGFLLLRRVIFVESFPVSVVVAVAVGVAMRVVMLNVVVPVDGHNSDSMPTPSAALKT